MRSFGTLRAARDAIRSKEISAVELTQQILSQIQRDDSRIHAFNSVLSELAIQQAQQVDAGMRQGPLAGVPIALKDNICTAFGTTTCSSRFLQNYRSPFDATIVQKLAAAGAVFIGKTNLDEFAMGSSTQYSATGTTHNPWDTDRVPGGSSGGSAAAVAGGMCYAAIGSDTSGSIRQPAAFCGLVGVKPTYGRISRFGLVAVTSSMDQLGPMTWTIEDAAMVLNVIAGHDPRETTSLPDAVPDYTADLDTPIKPLKIGIIKELSQIAAIDNQVAAAVADAIKCYQSLGAQIVEISLPHAQYASAVYAVISTCEATTNLARYDGIQSGRHTDRAVKDIAELYAVNRAEGFGDEVKRRLLLGTYIMSGSRFQDYFLRAAKVRQLIKQDYEQAFTQCDVILSPTTPSAAFKLRADSADLPQVCDCDNLTVGSNLAGIPSLSIPCGFTQGDRPLPIGLQLIGPYLSDAKLLRIARMYEQTTRWHEHRPQPIA